MKARKNEDEAERNTVYETTRKQQRDRRKREGAYSQVHDGRHQHSEGQASFEKKFTAHQRSIQVKNLTVFLSSKSAVQLQLGFLTFVLSMSVLRSLHRFNLCVKGCFIQIVIIRCGCDEKLIYFLSGCWRDINTFDRRIRETLEFWQQFFWLKPAEGKTNTQSSSAVDLVGAHFSWWQDLLACSAHVL